MGWGRGKGKGSAVLEVGIEKSLAVTDTKSRIYFRAKAKNYW